MLYKSKDYILASLFHLDASSLSMHKDSEIEEKSVNDRFKISTHVYIRKFGGNLLIVR